MNHFEIVNELLTFTNVDDSTSIKDIMRIAHDKCIEYSPTNCHKPCYVKREKCIYKPGDITSLPSDILKNIADKSKVESCHSGWIKLRVGNDANTVFEFNDVNTASYGTVVKPADLMNKVMVELYLPWNIQNLKVELNDFLSLYSNCTNIVEKTIPVNISRVLSHKCHAYLWQRLKQYGHSQIANTALRITLFTFEKGDNWNPHNLAESLYEILPQIHQMLDIWSTQNAMKVKNIDTEVQRSLEYREFALLNYLNICTFNKAIPSKSFQ